VKHLVYASSSSVYGMAEKTPFSEEDKCDNPASLYAATKKADELMAHVYSSIYKIPSTGLRFFTVYGPLGRPDMAPVLFMKAIMEDRPIKVFNHGNLFRDFTYIDDIVKGISAVINSPAPSGDIPYKIFNIGNSKPVALMDFIHAIEDITEKKAILHYTDMQPGDVYITFADTTKLEKEFGYKPQTSITEGVKALYESMYGKV
ncbi:MAG: NAD-dependent epimerase/dehydratase family protein, partial [Bacteroidia bacterium]|nr:NAD-dependent epimerase/dehydratase family protein [Bacteroidia bacterium]